MSTEMSTNRLRQKICKVFEMTYFCLHSYRYMYTKRQKIAFLNDNTGG